MPQYNITLKNQSASKEEVEAEKKKVTDKGGKIIDTFTLIKGFTAEFPEDHVSTLKSDGKLDIEHNGEVKTQ